LSAVSLCTFFVRRFTNHVTRLSASKVLAVVLCHFISLSKGVRFLGDVRTSDRSASLGAVAAGGLVSDQSTSVFPNSLNSITTPS
jgi:hypothetical protein